MYGFGLQLGLQSGKGLNGLKKGFLRNDRKSIQNLWEVYRSGNWSDPQIWRLNGQATNQVPNSRSNVVNPSGFTLTLNQTATINSLKNDGRLLFQGGLGTRILTINDSCIVKGALDISSAGSHQLILRGFNNYINPSLFSAGSSGNVIYFRSGDQNILNITYAALVINGYGNKYLIADLNCAALTTSGSLDLNNPNTLRTGKFNVTVTTLVTNFPAGIEKSDNSTNIVCSALTQGGGSFIILGSGVTMEIKGGTNTLSQQNTIDTNSILKFSTASSALSLGGSAYTVGLVLISGAITVTLTVLGGSLTITNTLTGDNASSIYDNRGTTNYQAATAPMANGQLQCNNAANTYKYNMAGNQDVTGGTYRTLEFGGSGVKTLLADVVVNTASGGAVTRTGTATINYNGFTIKDSSGTILTP